MSWAAGIWAGFGFDVGGEILFGLGNQTGILFSIEDLVKSPMHTRWCVFQQESATIGVGLGGSGGTNFVIGYNAATPSDFDGADVDFDFSLDLGLGKLDKYFRNLPEMIELAAIARKFDTNLMRVAETMKRYENSRVVKAAAEHAVKNRSGIRETLAGKPCLLSFPVLGGGLRLSLKAKAESTTVTSFGADDLSR